MGAFFGVFIISDISGNSKEIKEELFGIILASTSAIFTGFQFILMRKLNERETVHYLLQPYCLAITGVLFAILSEIISFKMVDVTSYQWKDWGYLFANLFFTIIYLTYSSLAYKYEKASTLTPL